MIKKIGFPQLNADVIELAAWCKWKRKEQKHRRKVIVLLRLEKEISLNLQNFKKDCIGVIRREQEKPAEAVDGCIDICAQCKKKKVENPKNKGKCIPA